MGRRGSSDSRSPPRRRGGGGRRRDSRSPSRRRRDDRSRSRGRGGRGGSVNLADWGTAGKIVEIKSAGFGFIRPHTGKVDDKDLHFHCSGLGRGTSFDDLQMGDEVTY